MEGTRIFLIISLLIGQLGAERHHRHHKQHHANRIIGGELAKPGEFPFAAQLIVRGGHYCGGVVISDRLVLTAAHCMYRINGTQFTPLSPSNFSIVVGSIYSLNPKKQHQVSHILKHPKYNLRLSYDLALMRVSPKFKFQTTPNGEGSVAPIDYRSGTYFKGTKFVTIGWGRISADKSIPSSSVLKKLEIRNRLESSGVTEICHNSTIKETIWHGDSGGALIWSNQEGDSRLVGIVSNGQRDGEYDCYTNVVALNRWLEAARLDLENLQ